MPDRAAILSNILARQKLRREAHLPLLDVRAVYDQQVEHELWREYLDRHGDEVRAQVLDDLRPRFGGAPQSAGGRLAVSLLVAKALREGFEASRRR